VTKRYLELVCIMRISVTWLSSYRVVCFGAYAANVMSRCTHAQWKFAAAARGRQARAGWLEWQTVRC
jgi:hypothetical protein